MFAEVTRLRETGYRSLAAEESVLGGLLQDPAAWTRIEGHLAPEDFHRGDHRTIYTAVMRISRVGAVADALTTSDALERAGELVNCGGLAYLGTLARDTLGSHSIEHHAKIVRDRAMERQMQRVLEDGMRAIANPEGREPAELLAELQQRLLFLQARSRGATGLVATENLAAELVDDLDDRREGKRGLIVGLSDFDDLTCGLEPGDLVVIAARPGMGKTALLVTIAAHVAQALPVAVFSAEMPARQLMRRAVALIGGISQKRLRRPEQLSDADWQAISRGVTNVAARRLWIDDTALPSLTHIRSECTALKARSGLGLVLVDYVQLVAGRGGNRYEQLREVSYGLKALAKDLQAPVIVLAQLNRSVESRDHKRPYLSDLRDSGAIEEAADLVGLLFSESYYNPNFQMRDVLECNVEKHRNGERGQCLWSFSGAHSRVTVLDAGDKAQYRRLLAQQSQRGRGGSDDL